MKKRILFITSTYRTGEKVYPILDELSLHCDIDVMNLYQMSPLTAWDGSIDLRQNFYNKCDSLGLISIAGPEYFQDKEKRVSAYKDFIDSFDNILKNHYHLVFFDNNIAIKSGKTSSIYKYFYKKGITVVGAPHGNREAKGYKVLKHIQTLYDYSFVFGKKEINELVKADKKNGYHKSRLLAGGIPANDKLKHYKKTNNYILIIPNFTDPEETKGITRHFSSFTKKEFDNLRLLSLADKYGCGIVVKEKKKLFHKNNTLKKALRCYKDVKCISECKDDNKLIADAMCVISAPSTLAFKSIQIGIPTVLLKKHGMVGNFYDFSGLVNADKKSIDDALSLQIKNGKCIDFIENTLEGGLSFNSTKVYIDNILKLLSS